MELCEPFDDIFDDLLTISHVSPFVFDTPNMLDVDTKLIMEKIDMLQNMLDQMATENESLKKRNRIITHQLQTFQANYKHMEENYLLVPKVKK